jgi:hypothetical protein
MHQWHITSDGSQISVTYRNLLTGEVFDVTTEGPADIKFSGAIINWVLEQAIDGEEVLFNGELIKSAKGMAAVA